MQEKHVFEYAVVRVVPIVEREEFINIGVVLFCNKMQYLDVRFHLDEARLQAFCCTLDVAELQGYANSFARIVQGNKKGTVIESLPQSGRFRWLTAKRSSIIQTSPVHPGLTDNPSDVLDRLFKQLVL